MYAKVPHRESWPIVRDQRPEAASDVGQLAPKSEGQAIAVPPKPKAEYTTEEQAALQAKLPQPCQRLGIPYKEGWTSSVKSPNRSTTRPQRQWSQPTGPCSGRWANSTSCPRPACCAQTSRRSIWGHAPG